MSAVSSKTKNILLVYPDFPKDTYWSFNYALKFISKKAAMPPLGLITVASFFPEDYTLKLVDMNVEKLTDEDILWADAVFISAMIVQKDSMQRVIDRVGSLGRKIIVGGPYSTTSTDKVHGVDHILVGEVEPYFDQFLSDFENGTAQRIYRCDSRADMSKHFMPRYDLLKLNAYASMAVQYCRGCPFCCDFCDIWKVYGRKPRFKQTTGFVAELDRLLELGWRGSVFVVDDNFIGNRVQVKKDMLPEVIAWQEKHNFPFRFYTEASVDLASDVTLMEMMRDAGFNEVFLGIETPEEEALKEANKGQNLRISLVDAVEVIQRYGMAVTAGFIVGFDSDTEATFDRQIEFIQKTGIVKAMIGVLTPLPGTDFHERMKKEGRLVSESTGNNTHAVEVSFKTVMDSKKLLAGYNRILTTIYGQKLKHYFTRCYSMLKILGLEGKYLPRSIAWFEIMALLRSVSRQPFTAYGWEYIKFISKVLFSMPSKMPDAFTYAIIGHHFYTITQETIKKDSLSAKLDEMCLAVKNQLTHYSQIWEEKKLSYDSMVAHSEELYRRYSKDMGVYFKSIKKIHRDFRGDLSEKHQMVEAQINAMFRQFVSNFPVLANASIAK